MYPSTKAWIGLWAYVLLAEAILPRDDMLSHAFDRWMKNRFKLVLLIAATSATVAHLFNLTPPQIDAFGATFRFVNWLGNCRR